MYIKLKIILFVIYLIIVLIYFICNCKRIGSNEVEGEQHKITIYALLLESLLWPLWLFGYIYELFIIKANKHKIDSITEDKLKEFAYEYNNKMNEKDSEIYKAGAKKIINLLNNK